MPKRDVAPNGAPCWVDIYTTNPDRSRDFYGALFGWTSEDAGPKYGGYVNFSKNGALVAGLMRNDGASGEPNTWNVYLATDDAPATVDAAAANGGEVIVPAMAVHDLGTMAVVSDAGQAPIGIWQPALHKGFGLVTEAGAPSWFELRTRNYDAAIDFYRKVFRWDTQAVSNTSELEYTMLVDGDEGLAGVIDARDMLADGAPGQWLVYFGSDDPDATLARTVELGGTIVSPAEDTQYGRLATAADPTGAIFKLLKGNG